MAYEEEHSNPDEIGGLYNVYMKHFEGLGHIFGSTTPKRRAEHKSSLNVASATLALGGLMLAAMQARKLGKK
jgi:hypothetical protein